LKKSSLISLGDCSLIAQNIYELNSKVDHGLEIKKKSGEIHREICLLMKKYETVMQDDSVNKYNMKIDNDID